MKALLHCIWDAGHDVIDLDPVLTDLVEIRISEAERFQTGQLDAMAADQDKKRKKDPRPMGKRVY